MAVRFECSCGKKLKASDEKIGKKVLCSGCGKTIRVPDADSPSTPPPPTAAPSIRSTSAAHIASDLLRKTAVDSEVRARTSFDEEPAKSSDIDYVGTVRQLGYSILPGIAIFIVVIIGGYMASSYLIRGKAIRPPLAEVTGTVTLEGAPLSNARITFVPVPPSGETVTDNVGPSFGITKEDGTYRLYYVQDVPGAAVGVHKVEIRCKGPRGEEIIPAAYNVKTQLVYEVKDDKDNDDAIFPLTSSRTQ